VKRQQGLSHVSPDAPKPPAPAGHSGRAAPRGSANLVTLGSAAVLAVYTAGFVRTKPAADRMAAESDEGPRRRPPAASTALPSAATATLASAVTAPNAVGSAVGAVPLAAAKTGEPAAPAAASADAATKALSASDANVAAHDSAAAKSGGGHKSPESGVTASTPPVTSAPNTPASAPVSAPVSAPAPVVSDAPPAAPVPAPAAAPEAPAAPPKVVYKDGAYIGRGTSRHGDIEAMVEIKDGKITSAIITQCLTRYSCSWINPLIPQVAQRQSAEVDYVSGATQSSNAFYYAVLQALAQAK
jgi:uncharacterized protein with FMN-binding domain